ncbi:5959_t:CDS:1, partial [Acaulospora morrowiae]
MSSSEQQFRESLRSFRWASNSNSNNINLSSNNKTPFARISENTSNFFENVGNR